MTKKAISTLALLLISFIICKGQNFVLDERSTATYSNYWEQIRLIEKSIRSGTLDKKINFYNGEKPKTEDLILLSKKFNKNNPDTFFNSGKPYPIIDTDRTKDSVKFIKWTYANIDGANNITVYLQLIVYLRIDTTGNNIFFPQVESFNVLTKEELTKVDKQKMLKYYIQRLEDDKKNPPPPPPGRFKNK